MTPKDKAKELVELYCQLLSIRSYEDKDKAKQCALIAVDELISISLPSNEFGGVITNNTTEYWREVKKEIELL